MAYGQVALERVWQSLGRDDAWTILEERNDSPDGDHPFNALAVVSNGELRLRFVVDRGREHLGGGCQDEMGHPRWVPLEIVGLAGRVWTHEEFREHQQNWCDELDVETGDFHGARARTLWRPLGDCS